MTSDMLKNLLILQHQAAKTLIVEYHQQTEAYVQQFKRLPVSQDPAEAAHDAKIPLRELNSASPSLTDGCAVSELILQATKDNCGADVCATSPDHLEAFLETARKSIKTAEDRVHFLFVLDATLAKSRSNSGPQQSEMLGRFESKQGYALLVEWFAACCSYKDEASKAFVELLLLVLQRNVPGQQYTRKKLVRDLSNYKKFLKGKKNKELFQTVTDKYRESFN